MVETAAGEPKAGRNIFHFKIRLLFEGLLLGKPCSEKIQDLDHSNPHPANARASPALRSLDRNALDKFSHDTNLLNRSAP